MSDLLKSIEALPTGWIATPLPFVDEYGAQAMVRDVHVVQRAQVVARIKALARDPAEPTLAEVRGQVESEFMRLDALYPSARDVLAYAEARVLALLEPKKSDPSHPARKQHQHFYVFANDDGSGPIRLAQPREIIAAAETLRA